MKTLKTLLSVFAIAAVFSTGAMAQGSSDQATVATSATVQTALSVANVADLAFGTITTTETPTISATDANAGAVDIQGAATGVTLNVQVTYPSVLTDGTPANDLTFANYESAYRLDGTNDATGATDFGTVSGQVLSGSFTSTANTMYIYVGGQITDASNGVAGNTYNNDITVQVSYN